MFLIPKFPIPYSLNLKNISFEFGESRYRENTFIDP